MKLRMRGNSLRFRLTKTEVQRLAEEGLVAEKVSFAPQHALTYCMVAQADAPKICASLQGSTITVTLPLAVAQSWHHSDQVSLEEMQGDGAAELKILVEKDFACLKVREGEDDSDAYLHPSATNC